MSLLEARLMKNWAKLNPSRGGDRVSFRVMPKPTPQVADAAPTEARLTDYDRAHLPIYMRLLDAADAGAPWDEAARIVLGIDPTREPDRAKRAYDSHLARARWMMDHGYRHLLQRR